MAISTAARERSGARRRIGECTEQDRDHGSSLLQGRASYSELFLDTVRHPLFDVKELRSETIVHLLRRLERPFTDTAVHTYNLWKEGDGNQRLELVVRDFLDVFREIMRSPEWRDHFDLTFQPIFDAVGRRLVGQTDTAVPTGRGSKLYELNLYAMTLGRAKQRTVSLEDELAKRAERKAAELARAASKRRETWADKRRKSGA